MVATTKPGDLQVRQASCSLQVAFNARSASQPSYPDFGPDLPLSVHGSSTILSELGISTDSTFVVVISTNF